MAKLASVTLSVALLVMAANAMLDDKHDKVNPLAKISALQKLSRWWMMFLYHFTFILSGDESIMAASCCPKIITGPHGSIIESSFGWRGNVTLVISRGNCTSSSRQF